MAELILRPDGVGHYTTGSRVPWDPVDAPSLYESIDEADENGDFDYVVASSPGPFTVELQDFATQSFVRPGRVAGALAVATIRTELVTPVRFKFRMRFLDVDYDSPVYEIDSTDYVEVAHNYPYMPNGIPWTAQRLNGIEIGLVYVDGQSPLRCTKMELQVHAEAYPHQGQAAVDDSAVPEHQQWHNHPGTMGAYGSVGRFDGDLSYIHSSTLWDPMTTPTPWNLFGVHGYSDSGVIYAVGTFGTVLQLEEGEWVEKELDTEENLKDVWSFSDTLAYAVGENGTLASWDGFEWKLETPITDQDLHGIWGLDPSNIYAVGTDGTILHYDGVSWSNESVLSSETFNSVFGTAANSIFTVGTNGTVYYYNGISWGLMPAVTPEDLTDIWAASSSDVYVVGENGTILYYNGAWSTQISGTTEDLNTIWGDSTTGSIVAAGAAGTCIRFDGSEWVDQPTHQNDVVWRALWGTLDTQIYLVGNSGKVVIYDEISWQPLSTFEVGGVTTPLNPGNIDRIQSSCLVKNIGATPARAAVVLRANFVDYFGSHGTLGWEIPPDGQWHLIEEEFLNSPQTGWPSGVNGSTPWGSGQADTVEVGIKNFYGNLRCTTLGSEVFQKHTPISTADMYPTGNPSDPAHHSDLSVIVGGGDPWQNIVATTPPSYDSAYIGANADTAGTSRYSCFPVGPPIGSWPTPPDQQAYALEVRMTVRLGSTESALVAPIMRYSGETFIGKTFPIDNTGTAWFDLKQDFFTSPFSGDTWTLTEIDGAEYGIVILSGEVFLTQLRVQLQTAPDYIVATPDPNSIVLTDVAKDYIDQSLIDGTMYAVRWFAVSSDGFDPASPTTVVAASSTDTTPYSDPDWLFQDRIERITYNTADPGGTPTEDEVTYWCRVPRGEARTAVGSLGLYAELLHYPLNPGLVGTKFLFARVNFPCQCKHERSVHFFKIRIEYPDT